MLNGIEKKVQVIQGIGYGNGSILKLGLPYMMLGGIGLVCPLPIIMPDADWKHAFVTGMYCAIRFHGDCRASSM